MNMKDPLPPESQNFLLDEAMGRSLEHLQGLVIRLTLPKKTKPKL